MNDFRPDLLRRENLQQQCMRSSAVNDVNFVHALLEGINGGIYFRNHAAAYYILLNEILCIRFCETSGGEFLNAERKNVVKR